MPEPKPRVAQQKSAVKKIQSKLVCHIHDEVGDWLVEEIRENVCVSDLEYPLTEFEGKHYCLFHLPIKEKDTAKFAQILQNRLEKTDNQCRAVEAEFPDDVEKQNEAKRERYYDFRYVWFPSDADFISTTFSADANFSSATFSAAANFNSATFSADADFSSATFSANANLNLAAFSANANFVSAAFSANANFVSTTFSANANFSSATFILDAHFISTTFSADANFVWAVFSADANFVWAAFSADANFSSAKFLADAYFNKIKFSKTAKTDFDRVSFEKDIYFYRARFRNDVSFNSALFGKESDVFFHEAFFAKDFDFQYCTSEGYLRFSNLRQGKENTFAFDEAAFEKASRIAFHTVRLHPNWFVNVDSRKFVFTDIDWRNLESKRGNENITAELAALEKRGIKTQGKRLLEIAARQLAVNAEENNRYEDAAEFRYLAMETKRLELLNKFSFSRYLIWLYKWTSGYGESWSWAALVLLGVLLSFGILYATPVSTFDYGEKKREFGFDNVEQQIFDYAAENERYHSMNLGEGLVHSLYVSALQRPEPKPADTLTKLFVILETIFAPLQAALLALAIRRKFMR